MTQPWKPNVTVAAIVERAGRFLLVEEHTPEGARLNQPAGHLESGETLLQAVVRETLEESACDFLPTALLGLYLLPKGPLPGDVTYLRVAFIGAITGHYPERALDTDIIRTLWLTREEIAQQSARLRSPLVLRCVDDYLAGQQGSLDLVCGERPLPRPLPQAGEGVDLPLDARAEPVNAPSPACGRGRGRG